jgi:hypothetical protein
MSTLVGQLLNKTFDLSTKFGANYLNRKFPNEFEYYFISLELVDSNKDSISYFAFPITPQGMTKNIKTLSSVTKTQNGINVEKTSTFEPVEIKISGNFGRSFLFMVGKDKIYTPALSFKKEREKEREPAEFSSTFKNGFGALKELEKFINKSKTSDKDGKPHVVLLYNPVFGDNLIVEITNFSVSTNAQNSNRMFEYSIDLLGIAPISAYQSNTENERKKNNKIAHNQIKYKLMSVALSNTAKYILENPYAFVYKSQKLSNINGVSFNNLVLSTANKVNKFGIKVANSVGSYIGSKADGIITDGIKTGVSTIKTVKKMI